MRRLFLAFLLALTITAINFGQAQLPGQNPGFPSPPQGPSSAPEDPDNDITAKAQKDMQKKLNEKRQAQLKRDTDKLLQLTNQLKEYVDKSNANILSVDVVRKAEEIEKLAHSVKEKMKGAY